MQWAGDNVPYTWDVHSGQLQGTEKSRQDNERLCDSVCNEGGEDKKSKYLQTSYVTGRGRDRSWKALSSFSWSARVTFLGSVKVNISWTSMTCQC